MTKRFAATLLVALFCCAGRIDLQAAESFVIAGNPNAPPVVWEENGRLTGLAPELVEDILGELAIAYTAHQAQDWQQVQDDARAGRVDLIVSAFKNEDRATYLTFSVPYLSEPTVIVVEQGKEFDISTWDSLKGKKGVSNVGESYGQEFDAYIADHLEVDYRPYERAIEMLNLGQADYLIIDLYTALIYSRLLQGEDRITILDPPVAVEEFHVAVRTDSALVEHLDMIDEKLLERVDSGAVTELLMTHYDRWTERIERRSAYFRRQAAERSADQQRYLEEQKDMARQRILETMTQREGLPAAAE